MKKKREEEGPKGKLEKAVLGVTKILGIALK